MLDIIFLILIISLLWYVCHDCNKKLMRHLSKEATIIFISIANFLVMTIYAYYHFDHCYSHAKILTIELIILIILVPLSSLCINIFTTHIYYKLADI